MKRKEDITLSDGVNTLSLILCDRNGRDDPTNITRTPYPRTATQISQGASKYDDVVLPYKTIHQDNWASGRGEDDFEIDTSRFFESYRANSEHENQLILGGREIYTTGHRVTNEDPSYSTFWKGLYGTATYYARKFTTPSAYTAKKAFVYLKRLSDTTLSGNIYGEIWSDSGGEPNALIAGAQGGWSLGDIEDTEREFFTFQLNTPVSLSGSTDYWLVVRVAGGSYDATHHMGLGFNKTGSNTKYSSDGSTWYTVADSYDMQFRIIDDKELTGKYFEYKGALYYLSVNEFSIASNLYLNGDRGRATSGSSTTLVDSTKTWSTNQYSGAVVKLISGPGSEQERPWRNIQSMTSTTITVANNDAWDISPGAGTAYVIIGATRNDWQLRQSLGSYRATDVVVAGDFVYIAFGSATEVMCYCEYPDGATGWSKILFDDNITATHLLAVYDPSEGMILWGSSNDNARHGVSVWRGLVPPTFNAEPDDEIVRLYSKIGELIDDYEDWESVGYVVNSKEAGVTKFGILASHTTGYFAINNLDEPVDLTEGTFVSFLCRSSIALGNDMRLDLHDAINLADNFLPTNVWINHTNNEIPLSVVYFDGTNYKDIENMTDENASTQGMNITIDHTDDYVFVGGSAPFWKLYIWFVTKNTNAATIAGDFFNGVSWTSMGTITDGTEASGKTFGQDGELSWGWTTSFTKGTSNTEASDLDQSLYWIRLRPSATLTQVRFEHMVITGTTGIDSYVEKPALSDGLVSTQDNLRITTTDEIIVMYSEKFNAVGFNINQGNTVTSTIAARYFNGSWWAPLTISSDGTSDTGRTLYETGLIDFDIPENWEPVTIGEQTGYAVRLYPSAHTSILKIAAIYVSINDPYILMEMPAMNANEWTWVSMHYNMYYTNVDFSRIKSVGFLMMNDKGAFTFELGSPIYITDHYPEFFSVGNTESRITGLEAYGEEQENPIVFKEDSIYEIQTQNNNIVVPMPLREIKTMKSEQNGVAHTTSDVYLVFNLGQHLERYYEHTLDDIGPDRDEGLPENRQGDISCVISYPGRMFASVKADEPENYYVNYSSILVRRGGGWHEVYRGPMGEAIRNIFIQTIPGDQRRLWFNQGSDLAYIQLPYKSFNPLYDSGYYFTGEGSLVTGWISGGYLDVEKIFSSVKIYSEYLSTGAIYNNQTIAIYYQVDNGELDSGWTPVEDVVNSSPFQEVLLSSGYDVVGRRIRFRFTLSSDSQSKTPLMKAWVMESILRMPVKSQWSCMVRLEDEPQYHAGANDKTVRAEEISAIMEAWEDSATVLSLTSRLSIIGTKNVVFEPAGYRTWLVIDEANQEKHLAELRLLEV